MYVLDLEQGQTYKVSLKFQRIVWVQVARGAISLNDQELHQGDGASVVDETTLNFTALEKAEILVFDLVNPTE
jgi:redox-sensitive bicupin YhaK (pirin superfamily)